MIICRRSCTASHYVNHNSQKVASVIKVSFNRYFHIPLCFCPSRERPFQTGNSSGQLGLDGPFAEGHTQQSDLSELSYVNHILWKVVSAIKVSFNSHFHIPLCARP